MFIIVSLLKSYRNASVEIIGAHDGFVPLIDTTNGLVEYRHMRAILRSLRPRPNRDHGEKQSSRQELINLPCLWMARFRSFNVCASRRTRPSVQG